VLKLKIEIEGKGFTELVYALEKVRDDVKDGFCSGSQANEDPGDDRWEYEYHITGASALPKVHPES